MVRLDPADPKAAMASSIALDTNFNRVQVARQFAA
jgi:hypothetical protein